MDVDVTAVPTREPAMQSWEIMTSESQERMLAIVTPSDLDRLLAVCGRWEVRATVVGRVTDTGRLRVLEGWQGPVLADVPAASLHDEAPVLERPMTPPRERVPQPEPTAQPAACGDDLLALLQDAAWVYRQYDHQLFLNTVVAPGADAALLRLAGPGVPDSERGAGRVRAIALSTDGNPRWCAIDPRAGTALVVAESTLNVACVGARPVALVNCLNFGNPEHPEVMWQLSEAIDGMGEACRALGVPVIGGNVSLYNESKGRDIDPTPVVGTLGLVERLLRPPPGPSLAEGAVIVLLGAVDAAPTLAGSRWAVERLGRRDGVLPPLDLDLHRRLLVLVAALVAEGAVSGVHDVSDGGLGVALAEMAVAGRCGFQVEGVMGHAELFGEGPSRAVVCVTGDALAGLRDRADAAGVGLAVLGRAGGDRLVVSGLLDVPLEEAVEASQGALPAALGV